MKQLEQMQTGLFDSMVLQFADSLIALNNIWACDSQTFPTFMAEAFGRSWSTWSEEGIICMVRSSRGWRFGTKRMDLVDFMQPARLPLTGMLKSVSVVLHGAGDDQASNPILRVPPGLTAKDWVEYFPGKVEDNVCGFILHALEVFGSTGLDIPVIQALWILHPLSLTFCPLKGYLQGPKRKGSFSKHQFFRGHKLNFRGGAILNQQEPTWPQLNHQQQQTTWKNMVHHFCQATG